MSDRKFQIGDRVKILRRFDGRRLTYCGEMDAHIGLTGTVTDVSELGNVEVKPDGVSGRDSWYWTPDVLRIIEDAQ